jgi:hypothetical protein
LPYVFDYPKYPSPDIIDSPVEMMTLQASQQIQQVSDPQVSVGYFPQEPYYNGVSPYAIMDVGTEVQNTPYNGSFLDLLEADVPIENPTNTATGLQVPRYRPKPMLRGAGGGEDKFFEPPYLSEHTINNEDMINILAHQSDEQVEAINNVSCGCPPVKYKCDAAKDSALFVRTTHKLITYHGVEKLADIFRHVGLLGDRCCVQCKKPGMGCVSGTFQCINCMNKRGILSFAEGFDMWLDGGQKARHAERIKKWIYTIYKQSS